MTIMSHSYYHFRTHHELLLMPKHTTIPSFSPNLIAVVSTHITFSTLLSGYSSCRNMQHQHSFSLNFIAIYTHYEPFFASKHTTISLFPTLHNNNRECTYISLVAFVLPFLPSLRAIHRVEIHNNSTHSYSTQRQS